ncbi:MAG: pyrroloquinoline quinone biosynthesis peptide chaperone PqqD [Anaerolineales bacterium]
MQVELISKVPTLLDNVILQEIDSTESGGKEMVIVLPNKNQIKVVNEVGSFVLHLIDGTRRVADIVAEVQRTYDAPPDQIENDVLNFIQQLVAKEILTFSSDQTAEQS